MLDMTGVATGTGTGTGAGTGVGTGVGTDSGTGDGPAVGMAGIAWPGTGMRDAGMADAVRLAAGWGRGIGIVGGGCAAHTKKQHQPPLPGAFGKHVLLHLSH